VCGCRRLRARTSWSSTASRCIPATRARSVWLRTSILLRSVPPAFQVCAQEPAGPAQRAGSSRPRGPGLSGRGRRFCPGQFHQPSRFARKNQLVQHSEQVHPGHAGQVCLVEDVDSAQVSSASLLEEGSWLSVPGTKVLSRST
jgi:hypothetical protein